MDRRRAAIVDVDGTLTEYSADRENRARESNPREEICDLVYAMWLYGLDTIFITARPIHQWQDTYDWICKHVFDGWKFPRTWLVLRDDPWGDLPDVTWKEVMYSEWIVPNWDVAFAIDDMERSVQVWRRFGLTVLHVRANYVKDEVTP